MQAPMPKWRHVQADFRGTEECSALTTAQRRVIVRIHNPTWHVGKVAVSHCTDVIYEELTVVPRLQVQWEWGTVTAAWEKYNLTQRDFNHPQSAVNSTKHAEV